MTKRRLAERIERIHAASGPAIDESDLPEGYTDPIEYLTDGDGNWNHERYARLLLRSRGAFGPASVALKELSEVEHAFDRLEARYLGLIDQVSQVYDGEDREELERMADRIASGTALDPEVLETIRACIVVLSENDDLAVDVDASTSDDGE